MISNIDRKAFIDGFITCMLWAESDESDDDGGNPFDQNYSALDISTETVEKIHRYCTEFIHANEADLIEYVDTIQVENGGGESFWEYAGHDLWLTSRGHGAGFWDRGLGELGNRLTSASGSGYANSPYLITGEIYLDL